MEIARLVLDYLKIILSWPVITAIAIIYFLRLFKEPISDFLSRLVKGQVYGVTVEATTPSEQRKEVQETSVPKPQADIEKYISENPQEVLKEYARVLNGYWFERGYNLIYGTQIALLEHLLSKGVDGDFYVNVFPFYQNFLNRSNLTTTQMADYLGFLRDMKFIDITSDGDDLRVKITPYGVDFLSYIKGQYPYSYKYKAF